MVHRCLLIASYIGNEIVKMNRFSGEIVERVNLATLPGAPSGPDDVVVGPDGSLYWTSLVTGYVGRLAPDGTVTSRFVAPGANAITLSSGGQLFVGLDFLGDGLYELDADLENLRALVPNQPGQFPLGFLNGFAFGPDGRLYGPLWLLGMVVSFDVTRASCNETLDPWTDCDIRVVAQDLDVPSAVKFDSRGRLYVTSWGAGRVLRIDDPTALVPSTPKVVARLAPGLDNLVLDRYDHLSSFPVRRTAASCASSTVTSSTSVPVA